MQLHFDRVIEAMFVRPEDPAKEHICTFTYRNGHEEKFGGPLADRVWQEYEFYCERFRDDILSDIDVSVPPEIISICTWTQLT